MPAGARGRGCATGSPTTARASAKRTGGPAGFRRGTARSARRRTPAGAHLLGHLFLDTHLYWKRARTSA